MAALQSTVDDQLINFSDLYRSIRICTFTFSLPSSVRKHIPNNNKRNREQQSDYDAIPFKCVPVQNPYRSPRWKLRKGEDYHAVFNTKHSEKRPMLYGVRLCPRWHIKGVCFTGCNLAATHRDIRDTALQHEMDSYCKLCYGE